MHKSTAILSVIFLILATVAACFLLGGTLSARLVVNFAGAEEHPDAFRSIRSILASGAAPQTFTDAVPDRAEGCRLEDVTINLRNRGLLDAEWLHVEVENARGDIAVYSMTGEGSSVYGRGSGSINLKLITSPALGAPGGDARVYRIQYYVYGMKRTITVRQE